MEKNPDARPIFHSDRGFQYTNRAFAAKLTSQGMTQSMSRVGRCLDNAPMEGFWGTLKSEMFYLRKGWNRETLTAEIDEYIMWYNTGRGQPVLGVLTPIEYREQRMNARRHPSPS